MSLIQEILKEMAAGGSTGAGSIAVNTDRSRHADKEWRREIIKNKTPVNGELNPVNPNVVKQRVEDAKKKLKKKKSFIHRVKKYLGLAEASDMSDVVSRLKDMENRNIDDTVTYGLEDDDGNLMKISVRAEKAKEFEQRLSYELSNAVNMNAQLFSNSDSDEKPKSNSMAELLFRLKNEFEIVDVEFPRIPKNAVYKIKDAEITKANADGIGNTDLDNPGDYDSEESDLDGMFSDDGSTDDMADSSNIGDNDTNLNGMGDSGDTNPDEVGADGTPTKMTDDDSVSDFDTGGDAGGAESLLQNIISMLKSDADAKKAQAEAEAEKARALQAEYSAKAAKASIEQQAELLSMEEEIKNQKRKEKEAKRISDLAKFRVKQTNAMPLESLQDKRNLIETVLFEFDEFDTVQTLLRQKTLINQQYRVAPGDDAATVDYKNKARMQAMRELNARIQRAKLKTKFNSQQQIKNAIAAKNNPNDQNQQNSNANQNNVQNNQGRVNGNPQAGRMV